MPRTKEDLKNSRPHFTQKTKATAEIGTQTDPIPAPRNTKKDKSNRDTTERRCPEAVGSSVLGKILVVEPEHLVTQVLNDDQVDMYQLKSGKVKSLGSSLFINAGVTRMFQRKRSTNSIGN